MPHSAASSRSITPLNGYLVGLRISSDSRQTGTKFLKEGILASLVWMVPLVNFIAPVLLAGSILHSRFLNTKGKE